MGEPESRPRDSEKDPAEELKNESEAAQDKVNQRLVELGYLDYGRDI